MGYKEKERKEWTSFVKSRYWAPDHVAHGRDGIDLILFSPDGGFLELLHLSHHRARVSVGIMRGESFKTKWDEEFATWEEGLDLVEELTHLSIEEEGKPRDPQEDPLGDNDDWYGDDGLKD